MDATEEVLIAHTTPCNEVCVSIWSRDVYDPLAVWRPCGLPVPCAVCCRYLQVTRAISTLCSSILKLQIEHSVKLGAYSTWTSDLP